MTKPHRRRNSRRATTVPCRDKAIGGERSRRTERDGGRRFLGHAKGPGRRHICRLRRTARWRTAQQEVSVPVTSPPPGTTVKIRVRTTGVSRRHRKATFTFNVEPVASQGVLVIVSCAVGYLWPLVGSKPARVRVVQGSDLEVPKSRGGAWASNINRMRAWDTFSPPTDTANHPTPIDAVLGGLRGSVPGDPTMQSLEDR